MNNDFEFGSIYTVSFSIKELLYKLKIRKRCPICKEKLQHFSNSQFSGYTTVSGPPTSCLFDDNVKEYTISSHYYCKNCDLYFSLTELANWKEPK